MNSVEAKYVHNTYQIIAEHFNNSRAYLWNSVKDFLDKIPKNSIILEVGSGNGKNLTRRTDCINLAVDLCSEFCKISQKKGIDSLIANNLSIPFKTDSVDYILSIAVIHHLTTEHRRLQAIREIVRVLKPGGKVLLQVWAYEQPKKSKNKFTRQDNLVTYKSPDKSICEERFYHVFKSGELDNLVQQLNISNVSIISSFWEVGNWVLILEKS